MKNKMSNVPPLCCSPADAPLGSVRKRKNYTMVEVTRSLCSTCLKVIDAKIIIRDNRVYMVKRCLDHKEEEVLLFDDASWYVKSRNYSRPGDLPVHYPTAIKDGCPNDCGYCPDHEQHACLSLIDVTDACNLSCPMCFSASGGSSFLSLDQIRACLDGILKQEGAGGVVQFSGGEPTLHPQIVEAVRLACETDLAIVMINTNGLQFLQDPTLARRLKDVGGNKLEIYLQFDGFEEATYKKIRGRALYEEKRRALDAILAAEIPVNLSCTVARGVNEHEIGNVVKFGLETYGVRGICFQPVFYSGRQQAPLPIDRVTVTEVARRIEEQTARLFRKDDFIPLPCPFPAQIAMTYAYVNGKKVKPIPRLLSMDRYLDNFTNTINTDPRPLLKRALEGLFSASASLSSIRTLFDFAIVCGIPVKPDFFNPALNAKIANEHGFRIVILQFMDRFNFELKAVKKSCIAQALPDGRLIPFDVYNTLYRESLDVSHWVPAKGRQP